MANSITGAGSRRHRASAAAGLRCPCPWSHAEPPGLVCFLASARNSSLSPCDSSPCDSKEDLGRA
eukprot:CAMPEP_0179905650 /NCGR_PEP_ID=MMETSP0982-20121206/42736_1 /TAXON_ID=483367 /ORGANISM="non described non described, Strain CCMP 2436" /LENGTH=64 /DNA_ID=CAMNT_0021805929 /DNA_START=524 /DNA_END=714 /DNA_ORIENTATION=-